MQKQETTAGARPVRQQRGIQSIDVGMRVLQALVREWRPMSLTHLAERAQMPPSKAHPYLVSFIAAGMVKQNPQTGHYELGPMALQMGLAALQQLDPLAEAVQEGRALAQATDLSVALVIWGQLGPTVVRIFEPRYPMHFNLRVGTVMALLNTVTGRAFAAFMPEKLVRSVLADEHARVTGGSSAGLDLPEMQQQLQTVRRDGMARGVSLPLPGVNSLSAPVFDADGRMALAITLIGPSAVFDSEIDGPAGQALRASADRVSNRLGYVGAQARS